MPRFLIEVPHDAEKMACLQAIKVFLSTGSHFVANAEWGCKDGDHRAWILLDADSKQDAEHVLPPAFRHKATIIGINRFTIPEVEEMLSHHQG